MDVGTLLGMTFMLFTGTQPDWADIAQKLAPASKAEILAEVKKREELCMEGDSVRVIPGQDPKEYSYTNYYEFAQAFDKLRPGASHAVITENMVGAVLPMINIDVSVDRKVNSIVFKLPVKYPVSLWHPEGVVVSWRYDDDCKIAWGSKERSPKIIEFVNRFIDEPYVFYIRNLSVHLINFECIGVVREGKMIVYDIDGGQYDGIEDMIVKKREASMFFTGTQPDWTDMAKKLLPASKSEILAEVIKYDEICMQGDTVRVLYDLDPKEYSYTNNYEFIQALNKRKGGGHGAISASMVDAVLPMVNLEINIDEKTNSVLFKIDKSFPVYLWHPEGVVVTWESNDAYNKIGGGYQVGSKAKEFVHKFLDEPYVFNIAEQIMDFKYIGVMRDGKMVVYDRDGNQYDGIEDMILKKYGSVKGYIEERRKPKLINLEDEFDLDLL